MASIKRRPNGQWRARYPEDGREHARHFDRKVDGQAWLDEVTTSKLTGPYIDPRAGEITLGAFYRKWSERQIWETETRRAMDLPMADLDLEATPLRNLKHRHGEAWVKRQTARNLAASTVTMRMHNVRSVLAGAVRDKLIVSDPFAKVSLPRPRKVEAAMRLPTIDEVRKVMNTANADFGVVIALAAFAGLRAGEIAGLQLADIEFLHRRIQVRRQNTPDGRSHPSTAASGRSTRHRR